MITIFHAVQCYNAQLKDEMKIAMPPKCTRCSDEGKGRTKRTTCAVLCRATVLHRASGASSGRPAIYEVLLAIVGEARRKSLEMPMSLARSSWFAFLEAEGWLRTCWRR